MNQVCFGCNCSKVSLQLKTRHSKKRQMKVDALWKWRVNSISNWASYISEVCSWELSTCSFQLNSLTLTFYTANKKKRKLYSLDLISSEIHLIINYTSFVLIHLKDFPAKVRTFMSNCCTQMWIIRHSIKCGKPIKFSLIKTIIFETKILQN